MSRRSNIFTQKQRIKEILNEIKKDKLSMQRKNSKKRDGKTTKNLYDFEMDNLFVQLAEERN